MIQRALWCMFPAILALGLGGCSRLNPDEFDELGSKSDYSVLQHFELEWRGKVLAEPRIDKLGEAEALGLPTLDQHATVWVLLKPGASPFYKQSVEGNYVVQASLVKRLVSEGRVSATVAAVLWSHTLAQ